VEKRREESNLSSKMDEGVEEVEERSRKKRKTKWRRRRKNGDVMKYIWQ